MFQQYRRFRVKARKGDKRVERIWRREGLKVPKKQNGVGYG